MFHVKEEKALIATTIEILDQEKETIFSDILKCCVCFELPKGKVCLCEEGHHFCLPCHNKMEFCGVCRGKLVETRNFVVEQLITKLGVILGISKNLPPAELPFGLRPGSYSCLHGCKRKMPAYQMLSHIRSKHPTELIDKVRSNPYSERFSCKHSITFGLDEKRVLSTHISDMGLFTFELTLFTLDFFGCVRMLIDKTTSHPFGYQLVVKIPNEGSGCYEFGVTDCPVSSYLDDLESLRREGRGLTIKAETLAAFVDLGEEIPVILSVWKKTPESENMDHSIFYVPKKHLCFKSDRKARRNRSRNRRRKKSNKKLMDID